MGMKTERENRLETEVDARKGKEEKGKEKQKNTGMG